MLILTAIVARLAAISSELREALAVTSKTIDSISSLLELDSSHVSEAIENAGQATPPSITREPPVPLEATQDTMSLPPPQLTCAYLALYTLNISQWSYPSSATIAHTHRVIRQENIHSANKAKGRAPHSTLNSKEKPCQDEIDDIFGF